MKFRICLAATLTAIICAASATAGTNDSLPVVLFDESHSQMFVAGQGGALHLSGLAALFGEKGCAVRTERASLTDNILSQTHILVVSGPFKSFTEAEIDAVVRFVGNGGRLAVMLHIASPAAGLLQKFGIDVTKSAVREKDDLLSSKPLDFRVSRLENHPITAGVNSYETYGTWGLTSRGETLSVIARTSTNAWLDTDRNGIMSTGEVPAEFGLLVAGNVGKGRIAVFGDDAVFQNMFLKGGNRTLGMNLAAWLKEGL